MLDYQNDYEEFWKPIVEKDGVLDLDQLKKELFDYHILMTNASEVYSYVTGGAISKPLTIPIDVKTETDRHYEELYSHEERRP